MLPGHKPGALRLNGSASIGTLSPTAASSERSTPAHSSRGGLAAGDYRATNDAYLLRDKRQLAKEVHYPAHWSFGRSGPGVRQQQTLRLEAATSQDAAASARTSSQQSPARGGFVDPSDRAFARPVRWPSKHMSNPAAGGGFLEAKDGRKNDRESAQQFGWSSFMKKPPDAIHAAGSGKIGFQPLHEEPFVLKRPLEHGKKRCTTDRDFAVQSLECPMFYGHQID
eukprot:TRINITY_DN67052_c0_g1_i1.p1 TRINITY_DN67052_c0_g1~~TRINITY_DN67052_c0_g1_i1.p1  ORF type:complete len:225 (-),score=32.92 TRINITY_DN67052_c0_g1_i1:93-767(-)